MESHHALFYGSYAALAGVLFITWFYPLPVLLQMTLYTSAILYIGSHLSLKLTQIDAKTGKKKEAEVVSKQDALLFPVFGSIALFSLYIAYRFLNPKWVNMLLTTYLTIFGCFAFEETIRGLQELIFPVQQTKPIFTIPQFNVHSKIADILGINKQIGGNHITLNQLILYTVSFGIGVLSLLTKSWVLHNVFAVCFCIQILASVSVGDFKRISLLLIGAFFYDIFWVFGTHVMVTVAKSFEGPVKIIFPVSKNPWQFSILGLGDIALPGIFLAKCLRFDYTNYISRFTEKENPHTTWFPKFYFYVVLVAYELGLLTTGLVMMITAHPQPALLYLVPFCLLSLFGAATLNGQVHNILKYTEETTEGTPNSEDKDK